MNYKLVGLALIACASSVATLAAATVAAPVVSSISSQPIKRQPLGSPVIGKDRLDPRLIKLDATLHRLYQKATAVGGVPSTAAMKLATPQAHLHSEVPRATPSVLVNITVKGDPAAAKAQLLKLDLRHVSVFSNLISGWLPVEHLMDAAALGSVRSMRASLMRTRTGSVTTQGDFVERSDLVRTSTLVPNLTGAGITVGVISDSFNCLGAYYSGVDIYANDIASGDLPANVNIVQDLGAGADGYPACQDQYGDMGTDEGRAMAQVIYDVAPGAKLAFHTADNGGEAGFANGILELAAGGATVITDDVGYFDEPFFQDGVVSQAIDAVKAGGQISFVDDGGNTQTATVAPVAYFSAAGNDARQSWEGTWKDSGTQGVAGSGNAGEELMTFTGSDGSTSNFLPIEYYPSKYTLTPILEWDQPYTTGAPNSGGNVSSLNICATDENGVVLTETDPTTGDVFPDCSGATPVGTDAVAIAQYVTPGTNFGGLAVSLAPDPATGLITPPPGRVKIVFADDGFGTQAVDPFATLSPTIQGHPGSAGAAALGATYWRHTPVCSATLYPQYQLEAFSSSGGDPILFDVNGVKLATPIVRQKPNFVAPDGGATSFFGSDSGATVIGGTAPICNIPPHSYIFRGTSEAAPHAAGVAALLLQAQPAATPDQIYTAMASTAIDMTAPGVDFDSGYGFIQADAALAQVLPTATLTPAVLAFGSVAVGQTSAAQTSTLTNTSGFPLLISSITTAPDYPSSNDCPASLAAAATCTITVSFTPTSDGPLQESIVVNSNIAGGTSTLQLGGTGTRPAITITPAALVFKQSGQSSTGFTAEQTVTVTSVGDAPLAIGGIAITGEFVQTNTCPASLEAGASCRISVSMSTSLDTTTKTGSLNVSSNASSTPTATVALSGTISGKGGSMPFWLLLPGLAAFAARRRKRRA